MRRGWNVTVQEVTPGRGNVWASRAGGGVTLSTHLDTVPPYVAPRLEGDRLYGRGACDAKGIAAAMLAAADRLADAGEDRVDLLLVVGEEKGSDGARAANHLPATSRFLINGEPTESQARERREGLAARHRDTRGREAHSAYPHLGARRSSRCSSCCPPFRRFRSRRDPVLGDTTVNIGTIRGGTEANIIPGECEAELMFRLVGDVATVKALIEQWAGDRAEITYGSYIPAQHFHIVPGFEVAPVAYTTRHPAARSLGHAAAVRSRIDSRRPHA